MKKLLNLRLSLLAAGLAAIMLTSTAAFGSENYEDSITEQQTSSGYSKVSSFEDLDDGDLDGLVSYNYETGETEFTPGYKPGVETYSNEDNEEDENYPDTQGSFDLLFESIYKMERVKYDTGNDSNKATVFIKLDYYDKSGNIRTTYGSGFLIGPNTVLTAGHLLYDKNTMYGDNGSHWSFNVEVMPYHLISSSGNPQTPYGYSTVKRATCSKAWAATSDRNEDWGIFELNLNLGNDAGCIDISDQADNYKFGTKITVNGYPQYTHDNYYVLGAQYVSKGTINQSIDKTFTSTDAFTNGGMSGGPCLIGSEETGFSAIGIEIQANVNPSTGKFNFSVYRRIDRALYNELIKYKTSTL